jgi:hypothetical protein
LTKTNKDIQIKLSANFTPNLNIFNLDKFRMAIF